MTLSERFYFVTGTDTDCGKTFVTVQFMKQLKASGKRVLGVKPIACGGEQTSHGIRNQDALLFQQHSDGSADYAFINPFMFELPVSPHIAAAKIGKRLDAASVAAHCLSQDYSSYDHIFFEGAGGVHAPINEKETMLDLMRAFNIPVILVVGLRLGCLNHAILSYRALVDAGLQVSWVANPIDSDMLYREENIELLSRHCERPLV
jgi:dethiobiotin synthetase